MIVIDQTLCVGCVMCVTVCPEGALSYSGMTVVDIDACMECLECLDYCPTDALIFRETVKEKHA